MYDIVIDPERLKHFPKTVPMNIREAVPVTAQALNRIRASKATQNATPSNEAEKEEATPEPAPAPAPVQENKVPAPAKHRGPHAEIIIKKPRSSKKVVS